MEEFARAHISPGVTSKEFDVEHPPHPGMTCQDYNNAITALEKAGLRESTRDGYNAYEPPPSGDGKVILDLVMSDMTERARYGREKYGTMLRAHNGRDALVDAYQEAMDLVMYLRQAIEERSRTKVTLCRCDRTIENGELLITRKRRDCPEHGGQCEACGSPDALNWHDGGLHCDSGSDSYVFQNVCPRCGKEGDLYKAHRCAKGRKS